VANLRVLVFLVAAVVAWLASAGSLSWGWILLPIVGYVGLVAYHVRLFRAIRRADRGVVYYERGLERIEGRWAAQGEDGARFTDDSHPFAADLDLFGPGSLFQRLNTARTTAGETTLAGWLKRPQARPEAIRDRQAAVADLASRLDLGDDVRVGLDAEALVKWGESPGLLPDRRLRHLARALGLIAAACLAGWLLGIETGEQPLFAYAFFATILAELVLWFPLRKRLKHVLAPIDTRAAELDLLAGLLRRLETEEFTSPTLRALREDLAGEGDRPSARIARLARLVRRLDGTRNPMVAPFSAMLMTPTRLAFAVEDWRLRSGHAIAGWIDAVGRIEAFGSLGAYAFENPDDPYPEIVDDGAVFDAEAIGHPLIPPERSVRNTLRLGGDLRVLIVSGSNMSGKSTLLRTVGINAVLAMVGGPVKAGQLRLSPLELGATLRVQDSLQAGASRFYAELTRLRQVVGLAGGSFPLLFLLDEIFHGTNSDDRRVGAGGVVRGLLDRGAIGLVTTHDLALTVIADGLAPRAANVHFSDRFEDGRLVFDYTMKPGVVEHSNALALMRAVGLDV
jgi:MutS domain V